MSLVALVLWLAVPGTTEQDTSPPRIIHEPCENYTSGEDFTVLAQFSDDSKVFDPKLIFRSAGGKWKPVSFTCPEQGECRATIKTAELDGALEYFIEVFDENGNGPTNYGTTDAPVVLQPVSPPPSATLPKTSATNVVPTHRRSGVGLLAGGGLASTEGADSTGAPRWVLTAGGSVYFEATDTIVLETDVLYAQRGGKDDDEDVDLSFHYLQVPILVSYRLHLFHITLAPALGVYGAAKLVSSQSGDPLDTNAFDAGILAGCIFSFKVRDGLSLELQLRYDFGLTIVEAGEDYKNRAATLLGGVRF